MRHYNLSVDPLAPLTEKPTPKQPLPVKDYRILLLEYQATHAKPLAPVNYRPSSPKVPPQTICPLCSAPHSYIYYNDGQKRRQLKCKVCSRLFQLNKRFRKSEKSKFFCPYCHKALFRWKEPKELTIYKCCNDHCSYRTQALNKLNPAERLVQKSRSSQFKLNYQYREYHYKPNELLHSEPDKSHVDLSKIHNSPDILGLILTFYVSFAMSARKTALILRSVFNIKVSYQTVLNYAAAAAIVCHSFNLKNKGPIDSILPGDETYIKVMGKHHYIFFFIASINHKITAYHFADNRGTQPAIIAMNESMRTATPDQKIIFVTDANPSYPAGTHFINSQSDPHNPIQMPELKDVSTPQGKWAKILSLAA